VLGGAVALQRHVDLVGHPQQRQLAQRDEVAGAEIVGQRRVDLLGTVDVAVGHPPAQRFRGDVDQFELIGAAHDVVGDALALPRSGDALDDVAQRGEVLHVDRGQHLESGGEQVLDVLPSLGVGRARRAGMGELVDQHHLGGAGQHRGHVELGELRAAVGHPGSGQDLHSLEQRRGLGPVVGLDQPHHDVGAALGAAAAFVEHRVGLADPGSGAEIDSQLPAPCTAVGGRHPAIVADFGGLVAAADLIGRGVLRRGHGRHGGVVVGDGSAPK